MHYDYKTKGTCSRRISFDLLDGAVRNVRFEGGCDGNLKALPILVDGMSPEEIVSKLEGVTCGHRNTSCADQLAQAVRTAEKA